MIRRLLLHFVLPLAVLATSLLGARALMQAPGTSPTSEVPRSAAPLVEVHTVRGFEGHSIVTGNGVIEPEHEASVSSEVSGRVVLLSSALVVGGWVKQREFLVAIDDRLFRLAIAQKRSQLRRAELELEIERSAADAARREWAVSGRDPPADARRIALREPQVELARENVAVARSGLEIAQLDLSRTTIRAPFNATVKTESVEVGDLVRPGTSIARLVGTDRFVARISLPVEQLSLLSFSPPEGAPRARTVITQVLSDRAAVRREGYLLRRLNELDTQTLNAQVLVAVEQPLEADGDKAPLFPGAFVRAEIEGRRLENARIVPRQAIFGGGRVWVVDEESSVHVRTLTVAFGQADRVTVVDGVGVGERVVMTRVAEPVDGMTVRVGGELDG